MKFANQEHSLIYQNSTKADVIKNQPDQAVVWTSASVAVQGKNIQILFPEIKEAA